jgi:CheY-like chemotaxis protein
MHGEIGVESIPGEGSTFWFRIVFDIVKELPPPIEPDAVETNSAKPGIRILVAEDNPTNQLVLLGLLRKLGYPADAAANGFEVLEAMRRQNYHLILMDCHMPGMDGFETTHLIREGLHRGIPIVAVTASAMMADRKRCIDAGMNDFIPKPIDVRKLKDVIARWCATSASPDLFANAEPVPPVPANIFDAEDLLVRLAEDRDLARELAKGFMADFPSQLLILQKKCAESDGKGVASQAHALRGACANVSAGGLCALAAAMEEAGKAGDLNHLGELLPRAADEFGRLRNALENAGLL